MIRYKRQHRFQATDSNADLAQKLTEELTNLERALAKSNQDLDRQLVIAGVSGSGSGSTAPLPSPDTDTNSLVLLWMGW